MTLYCTFSGKPHNHEFYTDLFGGVEPRVYGAGFQPGRPAAIRNSYPHRGKVGTFGSRTGQGSYWGSQRETDPSSLMKPKVITVVRNGDTPHTSVKILLNRRSVQSFDQLMKDIAEAFGPKWKNNKVRKLYTIKGREVHGVSDFFRDDEVFIGTGNEPISSGEVQEILEEIYPDSPYSKSLAKEWERSKRKNKAPVIVYKSSNDYPDGSEATKKDSGLGSDSSNKDDADTEGGALSQRSLREKKKDRDGGQSVAGTDDDFVLRLERERQRAADQDREKARFV